MNNNPWLDPKVAEAQRALADSQFQGPPWPRHFNALAKAVDATKCSGAILEVGCGPGHTREVLDRAGIEYRSFAGQDISPRALQLAKERYPESAWVDDVPPRTWDIVIDGSLVLHMQDWRAHLEALCASSRRWVILHRIPIVESPTTQTPTRGYGHEFPAWEFNGKDIADEMAKHGFVFVEARTADGPALTLTFAKPRHFATYADRNYLGRLKALHVSMVRHCGPFVLHVLAWDGDVSTWAEQAECVRIQSALAMGGFGERHPELAPTKLPGPPRSRVEHYWTCGPQWIADVMQATGEPVTYVDADIVFHSSPEPVFAEIGGAPMAVFPHNFALQGLGLPGPSVETHSVFGEYNVGLVHFADRARAERWAAMCREWCYDRVEQMELKGGEVPISGRRLRYGDQKFLEEFVEPRSFNTAHVVKHPGACLGPWAVHTRALDVRDGVIHFGNRPLVAYHYSGLRELPDGHSVCTRPEYQLTKRQEEIIYSPYWRALEEARK